MKKIIIVGAGMAGLSFAYECLLRGYKVTIIEASPDVGGLARSIYYNDCFLDIGVHISYLKDPQVYNKVKEIVDRKYWIKVKRNGKLYIQKHYIDWPLRYKAFFQFPLLLGVKIILDQLRRSDTPTDTVANYQSELIHLYGRSLYYAFFHPITKKFLKNDPSEVHPDWAYSTLRSSTKIEDKSYIKTGKYHTQVMDEESKKDFNILKFVLHSLTSGREEEPFYYFRDGFGMLVSEYKKKILKLGGIIKTNTRVEAFTLKNRVIEQCIIGSRAYDVDTVVWTGDPYSLCKLLGVESPTLSYLHTKYIYYFLKKCNKNYQVCYYADSDISFVRGSIFSNHSKTIIHNGQVSDVLCMEYSFASKSELFQNSDTLKRKGTLDLIKVGMIDSVDDIYDIYEVNVPNSYPLLRLDYRKKLDRLKDKISIFHNLIPHGRQGTFNYNNTDIIIKETLNHPMFNP